MVYERQIPQRVLLFFCSHLYPLGKTSNLRDAHRVVGTNTNKNECDKNMRPDALNYIVSKSNFQ